MKTFNESMISNYREFNNVGTFEIEGYIVKFNNNTKELETEYPYAKELRTWWFDIEETTTEKVSISDIDGLKFEIVNEFPKNYIVWDINTTSEYLPLCEVNKDKSVNTETLKCIKLQSAEDVQIVLTAIRCFRSLKKRTLEGMKKYFEKYNNNYCSISAMCNVKCVNNALKVLNNVGIE